MLPYDVYHQLLNNWMIMELRKTLSELIKPELNHIYTEEPFETNKGMDFGWFCREHAMHIYLLGLAMGLKMSIIEGDIYCRYEYYLLTTLETDASHVWCSSGKIEPIDASVTFRHFKGMPNIDLVFGTNQYTPTNQKLLYEIVLRNSQEQTEFMADINKKQNLILYISSRKLNFNPMELLEKPYTFLYPPPDGQFPWTEFHGEDIYNMITMHCYKLAYGKAKPLHNYLSPRDAIDRIKKWNPNAGKELRELLVRTP